VQTLTVTVINVEELKLKLGVIDSNLRNDLRNSAFSSLSTMLAFNEGLLGANQGFCADAYKRPVSGRLNANEDRQDASLNFRRDLTSCEGRTRIFADGGIGVTRVDNNLTTRGLAALRVEQLVVQNVVLGAALVGSTASDDLASFTDSRISDKSLQLNVYGRARLTDHLRFAAFAGWGRSWYSFRLEDDGLSLRGDMDGKRHMYGAALSGDVRVGSLTVTTDAILSRAIEKLASANLDASYFEESGSNIGLRLGRVDVTRLSVPVHIPVLFGTPRDGIKQTRLEFSPGLLCQDTSADSSNISCGYQLGLKLRAYPSLYSIVQAEARREVVDGYANNLFTIGFERRFGSKRQLAVGMGLERSEGLDQPDNRAILRLSVGR